MEQHARDEAQEWLGKFEENRKAMASDLAYYEAVLSKPSVAAIKNAIQSMTHHIEDLEEVLESSNDIR